MRRLGGCRCDEREMNAEVCDRWRGEERKPEERRGQETRGEERVSVELAGILAHDDGSGHGCCQNSCICVCLCVSAPALVTSVLNASSAQCHTSPAALKDFDKIDCYSFSPAIIMSKSHTDFEPQ